MNNYRRCPICRAYLDRNEECTCQNKKAPGATNTEDFMRAESTYPVLHVTTPVAESQEESEGQS